MRLLPELVTPAGPLHLPLSDASASGLIAALVSADVRTGACRLADALAQDPPLALWTLCRATARGGHEPVTLAQLAEWFVGAAMAELNDDARATDARDLTPTEARLDAWAEQAAQSQAVARLAAALAARVGLDADRAKLVGLLHAAPQWLAMAAPEMAASAQIQIVPGWLRDELRAIENASATVDSAAACVAWAARAIAGDVSPPGGLADFSCDHAAEMARIETARQQWRQNLATAELLPQVIGKLARSQRIEHEFERTLEAEKLESLKELAYGAGHEINNPLANISARAQTLLRDECDPERLRMLSAIHSQAIRAYEMIADMMLFARPPQPKFQAVDLAELARGVHEELAAQAAEQHCEWVLSVPDVPLVVSADKTQIAVALRAVCVNALEAMVTGGRVEVTVPEPAPFDKHAQLIVSDTGPGITAEVRRHIFDPFYSGREAGRGLGFGLTKCWRIVTMHGGSVAVDSRAGAGARFTILLPRGNVTPVSPPGNGR